MTVLPKVSERVIQEARNAIEAHGVSSLVMNDLAPDDLPNVTWSGGPLHPKAIADALIRAKLDEVDYLAIRAPSGFPVCIGGIDYVKHKSAGYIWQLSTVEELRGLGLGTRLIKEAERRIKLRGIKKAILGVEVTNTRAKALYDRLGYIEFDRIKDSWEEGDLDGHTVIYRADVILMRKSL
jgi:ribosomal protein S18 acetylase RimI-like enzyme